MGDSPFFLLVLVVLPLLLGFAFWAQRRRVKALQQWALATGWTYVGTDPSLVTRWQNQPFGIGRSRRTSELVRGTFGGRPAQSFVYRYTTGSGKNQSTVASHVLSMALPAYLPTLQLTPDGLGARLAKTFGGQDLRFESEDFNAVWRVEAPMAKFAYDVVHPRLMERLLRADATGMSLRVEGTDILCWSHGTTDLDAIAGRLQVLAAVVEAVPRFVWLEHGYDPGTI